MKKMLHDTLEEMSELLSQRGVKVTFRSTPRQSSCYGADLDSVGYVGTVTYWPETLFEFQFNSCTSGEVVFL